ncbi:MAG: hypothetical protein MUC77_10845, partial [Chromatiaceae bacterium]|nr:hypothetical protein [Chromatiaceae bacterium]
MITHARPLFCRKRQTATVQQDVVLFAFIRVHLRTPPVSPIIAPNFGLICFDLSTIGTGFSYRTSSFFLKQLVAGPVGM